MMSWKLPCAASSDALLSSGNTMSMSGRMLDGDLPGIEAARPAEHWHNVRRGY